MICKRSVHSILRQVFISILMPALCIPSWASCASSKLGSQSGTPAQSDSASAALDSKARISEKKSESSVTIEYVLGRDHYQFLAMSLEGQVFAHSSMERRTLQGRPIDPDQYPIFLKKASEFISLNGTQDRTPASAVPCKKPFKIRVKIGAEIQTTQGCRSADDGRLSKLIRDGEFLLYSKE